MKKYLILFCLLLTSISLSAQDESKCGTITFPMLPKGLKVSALGANPESDTATLYIPVTFNLIGTDTGTGYCPLELALESLCDLNHDFSAYKFHFYLENVAYFNKSDFYNLTQNFYDSAMIVFIIAHYTPNTMNLFVVQSTFLGSSFYTGYGENEVDFNVYPPAVTYTDKNSIVIRKNHLSNFDHYLTHEVGHYFGLGHSFDGGDWDSFAISGTPDTVYYDLYYPPWDSTLQLYWLVERADGVNCDLSGDLFCDTGPDYLSNGFVCDANQQSPTVQTDPVGATFRSDGTLYMSYSNDACQNRFSDGQVAFMRDVAQGPRDFLLYDQTQPSPFSPSDWQLLYPLNHDTIMITDSVTLEWDLIPEADFYVLEFGRLVGTNFHVPILETGLLENKHFNVAINPGFRYYWNVAAFSKYYPCEGLRDTSFFTVSSSVANLEAELETLKLYPNPSAGQVYWRLPGEMEQAEDATVQVFDSQGRLVLGREVGDRQALDLQGFQAGIYAVKVVAGERVYLGRFVKQ